MKLNSQVGAAHLLQVIPYAFQKPGASKCFTGCSTETVGQIERRPEVGVLFWTQPMSPYRAARDWSLCSRGTNSNTVRIQDSQPRQQHSPTDGLQVPALPAVPLLPLAVVQALPAKLQDTTGVQLQ